MRFKTKPRFSRLNRKRCLTLTFLSEPNSMISDDLNRAGKFGVALYLLPSLLKTFKKIKILIRNFTDSEMNQIGKIDLLGHIGSVFASKIHQEESSIFVNHARMHLRNLNQRFDNNKIMILH